MTRARLLCVCCVLSLALLSWSRGVLAQVGQPWLEAGFGTRGIGIRTGNLELHPGVAAETGYDSNYLQGSGDPTEPETPLALLRVTPSLSLETLSGERAGAPGENAPPPSMRFGAGAALSFDKLFPTDEASEPLGDDLLVGGKLAGRLEVSPERPLGADFDAGYQRISQPYNAPGALTYDRSVFFGGGDLRVRPGGGLLQWSLGYGVNLTRYDNQVFLLDSAHHQLRTRGSWRFLPRTALLYAGDFELVNRLQVGARLRNANPISTRLGLNGLITDRVALLALAGYEAIFFEPDSNGVVDDFDDFVGTVELTWFLKGPTPVPGEPEPVGLSALRVGYHRDGSTSDLSNYYRIDRGYGRINSRIGRSLSLSLAGGFARVVHALPRDRDGSLLAFPEPKEWRPEAQLFAELLLLRSVAAFANLGYSASANDNRIGRSDGSVDSLKYSRLTALFGARWFM